MLTRDPAFDGTDIYVYEYPSQGTIDSLAADMEILLDTAKPRSIFSHKEVIFLAHSMGGLVVRDLLLICQLEGHGCAQHVKMMYFYSTPTTGSFISQVATVARNKPPLRDLVPMKDDGGFLAQLQTEWLRAGFPIITYCALEQDNTYGVRIVDLQSAINGCSRGPVTIDGADHIGMVKPKSAEDLRYRTFLDAFRETRAPIASAPTSVSQDDIKKAEKEIKPLEVFAGVESVSAGAGFSCALDRLYHAFCWGENIDGKLGDGTTQGTAKPVKVDSNLEFAELSLGDTHACALTRTGDAYCWGANDEGQLGNSISVLSMKPVKVSGGLRFSAISAGLGKHTCALSQDGTVYCWGLASYGQLGSGGMSRSFVPVPVLKLPANMTAVSAGGYHSCAVTGEGIGFCWGYNINGALGDGTTTTSVTPMQIAGVAGIGSVAAGSFFTCGVTRQGRGYCWGNNAYGGLGNGEIGNSAVPVQIAGGLLLSSLSVGNYHACAVGGDGAAYCWGFGEFGGLGNGQMASSATPVAVGGSLKFRSVSAGVDHTCAVGIQGTAYCWGRNDKGQLGSGNTAPASFPQPVIPPDN